MQLDAPAAAERAWPRPGLLLGLGALLTRAAFRAGSSGHQRLQRKGVARRATTVPEGDGDIEDIIPFELRGFSLAQLFLLGGFVLLGLCFGDYFLQGQGGGSGIGAFFFIYAVPIFLLGAALSYAELQPIDVETAPDANGLWEKLSTPTMQSIRQDITRHRYGDDAHLDSSLKALGLTGPGRYPQLKKALVSKSPLGELEFTLIFESKEVPYTTWGDPLKTVAADRFFGPGIWSEIWKYDSAKKWAALKMTTGEKPGSDASKKKAEPATAAVDA